MPRRNRYKPRKDGLYEAKIQIGHKPDGTPNRVSVYAKTSLDLEKQVDDIKRKIGDGKYTPSTNITLGEYAKEWLAVYKASKSLATKNMYANIIDKHLIDIYDMPLSQISTIDIQRLINSKLEKVRTCEQIKLTLNQIFESAIDDDLLTKNPCRRVSLPQTTQSIKRALTDTEIASLATANFTDKERAFVYILYGCGMRKSEVLALTKDDIDFDNNEIIVNKSLAHDANSAYEKSTKSYSSIRSIEMPSFLRDYLKEYLKTIDVFLFTMADGNQMSASSYTKMWQSITRKMNEASGGTKEKPVINGLTAHIFRHNYCTMLYYSDISIKKACDLMGHSDTKMIMNVYSHLDERKEKTKEKIEKYISL